MSYPQDVKSALTVERIPVPPKQLEEIFRPGVPLLISDFSQEQRIPYALVRLLNSWKCEVVAFIPVITRKGPSVLIMLAAQDRNILTPALVQPYANMAELIGTALEKVIALQSMEKRLGELQTINEVSQTISVQTDLDVLYKVIHRATTQIMGEVSFLIALYDAEENMIQIPYMVEESRRMSVDPFPLGEGLTSILIKTSRPLMLVEDTENRARALGAKVLGAPAKSWLGVPLLVGGEVIGAIVVQDIEHEHRFNENDLRLLSTFASQVAIAIRNARLLEDSRRTAEHEHLLSEISSKVRASPDISMVLRTAILELSKAMHASSGLIRLEVGKGNQPGTNGNHGKEDEV
jgi:transcriptional regulator with GAF, ATPase, and Fis domain